MLSRWHNLSMQTVENQPDMKPWTLGPIPLLNHSAWSGGSKASSTLSALSRLCSAYEPLTTGLGQGYNPHCRPQEIFFETYHLNIHRGKVLGYKTLHCTVAYYEVVMVFLCWKEHLPSMDIWEAGDILTGLLSNEIICKLHFVRVMMGVDPWQSTVHSGARFY